LERVGNQNILNKPLKHKAKTAFKIAVLDCCNWLEGPNGCGKEFLLENKEKLGSRDRKNQHSQWDNEEAKESLSCKRKASYEMLTFASYQLLVSFHPSKRAHLCSIIWFVTL